MKALMQNIFYTTGMGGFGFFFSFLYLVLLHRDDLTSNFYTGDFCFLSRCIEYQMQRFGILD